MEMQGLEKRLLRSAAWRVFAQRGVLPWILRFADLPSRADVLEVGTGGGFNAEALLERFPDWHVVASDYDPEMVELAGTRLARFGERVRVEQADAIALPYPDRSFDLVISILVWHHVGAWERATVEVARVLRSGGRLLLVDVVLPPFAGPLGRPFRSAGAYTLPQLRTALRAAGFARWRKAGGFLWYQLLAETTTAGGGRAQETAAEPTESIPRGIQIPAPRREAEPPTGPGGTASGRPRPSHRSGTQGST